MHQLLIDLYVRSYDRKLVQIQTYQRHGRNRERTDLLLVKQKPCISHMYKIECHAQGNVLFFVADQLEFFA